MYINFGEIIYTQIKMLRLFQEGRTKVKEIRGNLRNLEATSQRLHAQVEVSKSEINETFKVFSALQERNSIELLKMILKIFLKSLFKNKFLTFAILLTF